MKKSPRFWSDDFDFDILRIFPNLPEAIGATADYEVWTVGSTTHGRLNHPSVWNAPNGMRAFFWFDRPNLDRDKYGNFRIQIAANEIPHSDNSPEIRCTWLEVLRDQWVHDYEFIFMPGAIDFPAPEHPGDREKLLYHIRKWRTLENIDEYHARSWDWLISTNLRFADALEKYRLSKAEIAPYFAAGAVPGQHTARIPRKPLDSL